MEKRSFVMDKVPFKELDARMDRFRKVMDRDNPDWEIAIIIGKVNQYYFTGTMQDGMLIIPREGEALYWVRRSYERALDESMFPCIKPMKSYRDAKEGYTGPLPKEVYLETESVPIALYERLQRHFPFEKVSSMDRQLMYIRSIKSDYELKIMENAGEIHRRVLEERVPLILREGMTEAELAAELFTVMMEEGHHGMARFGMYDTDIGMGHIAIGESSIYPTFFDGPGGNYGMEPASPFYGSRWIRLNRGDLVYLDVAFGMKGYHTDKTMNYMYGRALSDEAIETHRECVNLQNTIADMLKPGRSPEDIYMEVMEDLSPEFLENFMGYGGRKVRFLGHGIGLQVDEYPVIAEGFTEPLEEGMVIAIEPKKGIEGVGMVGIENTFIVTPGGGRCITGNSPGLILV